MSKAPSVSMYGVREATSSADELDVLAEQIRLRGYAVLSSGYSSSHLDRLSEAFDQAAITYEKTYSTKADLSALNELNTLRAPLALDKHFLDVAREPKVLALANKLIGGQVILNQQNGVINPPSSGEYNQGHFHRDLPYQHWISSHPLAINALFCLDDFSSLNGATRVVPASHKSEPFPTPETVEEIAVSIEAPRGSFLILDCMVYHSGGANSTSHPRRAINTVYSTPILKQQISIPTLLGDDFEAGDPELRSFLGYGWEVPVSVLDYLERRART